uniref:Putative ovule protein n=1 Tax=Solanum chacoense TaxID=4108 RepID=A0A0V0GTB0_SOLCH
MAKIVEVGKWNKVPLPSRFVPKEPYQGLGGRLTQATVVLCSKTRSLQEKLSQDKLHSISLHRKKPDSQRKRLGDGLTSESNCERLSLYI